MMNINFIAHTENKTLKPNSDVYFLGLSHKQCKSGRVLEAFCESTNSGKLINTIVAGCTDKVTIYKTNLVKGVPVNTEGKIRYPDEKEKIIGLQRFKKEIHIFNPKIVYLFGKQISDFILKNFCAIKINDTEYMYGNIKFILAEHPSYILVYKRKNIDDYASKIINKISYSFNYKNTI